MAEHNSGETQDKLQSQSGQNGNSNAESSGQNQINLLQFQWPNINGQQSNRYFEQGNYRQSHFNCNGHNGPKRLSKDEIKELVLRCRRFTLTNSSIKFKPNSFRFSIMSYNVLSQNLLENHLDLYDHCQESDLKWPQRGERIMDELLRSNSDILCLQEVHFTHFNELYFPVLKKNGYNYVYKQRTGDKSDGCAILYKENKFSLTNSIKLDFMRRDLSAILDRDNIAIIAELKPKHSNGDQHSKLFVANTHLLYNPKRGDIKLAQIRLLIAELDRLASIQQPDGKVDHNPIILCGDFNSEPNSLLFDFITKGSVNFDGHRVGDISGQREGFNRGRQVDEYHLKISGVTYDTRFQENEKDVPINQDDWSQDNKLVTHNLKLNSVFTKFEDRFGNKLVSTYNSYDSGLVDYIFYNPNKLRLVGFDRLLTDKHINQIGIPNSYLGSDHLSLKATFVLT